MRLKMEKFVEDFENAFGHLLGKTLRAFGNRLQKEFLNAGFEISIEQWIILVSLWRNDGLSQQILAYRTWKDKTTITRLIDAMEKNDYVIRVPDKHDRRHKLIYSTPKGKEILQNLVPIAKNLMDWTYEGIESQDLETTRLVLKQIFEKLKDKNLTFSCSH
jgi:MarR family transcriptional regulator, organic hydroperoxide resistance regulator